MASRDLADCEPALRDAWNQIAFDYESRHPGHELILTCTYRSPQEQAALYAKGRTQPGQIVTEIDGVTKLSNHNYSPARALDFAVVIVGKVSWDPAEYAPVGMLAEPQGLSWGGNWTTLKDYPHLELKEIP